MAANRHLIFLILLTYFANVANAYYPDYTDAERDAINKLRPLIADYLVPDYMKTDAYHLRLLKATKFDVNNAVEIAKRNNKWRKLNNIDEILNQDLNEYYTDFPFKIEGVDKEGSPILQFHFGKWKLRNYALSSDLELRKIPVKVFIQALETVEQKLYAIQKSGGQNISSTYVVDDMDGLSVREHVCRKCLSLMADLLRTFLNYPSLWKKEVVINAPKIFSRIKQLIDEILPSDVSRIIYVYAPNENTWRDEVSQDISADQLPIEFGGTQDNWLN